MKGRMTGYPGQFRNARVWCRTLVNEGKYRQAAGPVYAVYATPVKMQYTESIFSFIKQNLLAEACPRPCTDEQKSASGYDPPAIGLLVETSVFAFPGQNAMRWGRSGYAEGPPRIA